MTNRFALYEASFTQEEKELALKFINPILKSNHNSDAYQTTLGFLRAVGPDNLNLDFNEEDRKTLLKTPADDIDEEMYHWNHGLAFKDYKSVISKEDSFMYGGKLQKGNPHATNKKIGRAHV